MNISAVKTLENQKFANFAKGAAGAVYVMTAIKAVGRPAFIYADKHSDAETKKYTAGKEFLYQILCLGITVAMIPFFRAGGLKMAMKHLKAEPKLNGLVEELGKTKNIFKKLSLFEKEYKKETTDANVKKALTLGHGGTELGSFLGSIIGLTIVAPLLSHEILHPIMNVLGMEKKSKENNIGKPNEVFLADAKTPIEKGTKISTNA